MVQSDSAYWRTPHTSRIRAFDLNGSETSVIPVSPPASTTPVLAKLILDGDVPITAFSSRLDFGEGESLRPVNLFKEDTTLDSGSHMFLPRAHFTQKIDDKVTKAILMHLKTRQSWGSSTCSASRLPLSRLGLLLSTLLTRAQNQAKLTQARVRTKQDFGLVCLP